MLYLYPRLLAGYYVTAIGGALILMALLSTGDLPFLAILLLGLLVALAVALLFEGVAQARYKKVIQLMEDCRMQDFLAAHQPLLSRAKAPALRAQLSLNAFAGYYTLGDVVQGGSYLFSITPSMLAKAKTPDLRWVYEANRSSYFIAINDPERAQEALDTLFTLLQKPGGLPSSRLQVTDIWQDHLVELRMARGDYAGAAAYFAMRRQLATTHRRQVGLAYLQAVACFHDGDITTARECCQFIALRGGDTFYADWARIKLMPSAE